MFIYCRRPCRSAWNVLRTPQSNIKCVDCVYAGVVFHRTQINIHARSGIVVKVNRWCEFTFIICFLRVLSRTVQQSAPMPVYAELHFLSRSTKIKIEKRNIHFYLFYAVMLWEHRTCCRCVSLWGFATETLRSPSYEWNLIKARGRTLSHLHVHVCLSITWLGMLIARTNDVGDFCWYHSLWRSSLELRTQTKAFFFFVFHITHGSKVLMMFYCLHSLSNSWIHKKFQGLFFSLEMPWFGSGTKTEWKCPSGTRLAYSNGNQLFRPLLFWISMAKTQYSLREPVGCFQSTISLENKVRMGCFLWKCIGWSSTFTLI